MKKAFLIWLLFMVFATELLAQQWEFVGEIKEKISYIHFPDEMNGWCISSIGKNLYKTINGGKDWALTDFKNTDFIYFKDSLNGYVVNSNKITQNGKETGARIVLKKTTDGGKNFTTLLDDSAFVTTDKNVILYFPRRVIEKENSIYFVTLETFFYSHDNGKTWNKRNWEYYRSIFGDANFISENEGLLSSFFVETNGDEYTLFERTTDGGKTWTIQSKTGNMNLPAHKFEMIDSTLGFMEGYGKLFITKDYAKTWISISPKNPGDSYYAGIILDAKNIIVEDYYGILASTNGGVTFKRDMEFDDEVKFDYLSFTKCPSGKKVWAYTKTGLIYRKNIPVNSVGYDSKFQLGFFPNPAKSIVNMRLTEQLSNNADLGLYDNIGKKVISKIIPKGTDNFQIDISNLPNGIYNAVIRNGATTTTQKVVVAK